MLKTHGQWSWRKALCSVGWAFDPPPCHNMVVRVKTHSRDGQAVAREGQGTATGLASVPYLDP